MTDADLPRHIERGLWAVRDGRVICDSDGTFIASAPSEEQAHRLVSAHNRDLAWYENLAVRAMGTP